MNTYTVTFGRKNQTAKIKATSMEDALRIAYATYYTVRSVVRGGAMMPKHSNGPCPTYEIERAYLHR